MNERIARVTAGAATDRIVIDRKAIRVLSARTWTRIRTLVINARSVLWTFRTNNTTRSAGGRNSGESWLAEAHCVTVVRSTVAVGSTWRWITRINWHGQRRYDDDGTAVYRITGITRQARTHRSMIDHAASSILAASTRTWIDTFVVQTGLTAVAVSISHAFWSASNVWIAKVLR